MSAKKKVMTLKDAVSHMKSKRQITSAMMSPLGMTMEQWLQYAQLSKVRHEEVIDIAIAHFEAELQRGVRS